MNEDKFLRSVNEWLEQQVVSEWYLSYAKVKLWHTHVTAKKVCLLFYNPKDTTLISSGKPNDIYT